MTTLLNAFAGITAFWTVNSILVFVISAFCAGVLIPQILLVAFRKQLFDIPDERKIHQGVVPRLGGIAFKPVVFFSMAFLLGISQLFGYGEFLDGIFHESRTLAFGFCCRHDSLSGRHCRRLDRHPVSGQVYHPGQLRIDGCRRRIMDQ